MGYSHVCARHVNPVLLQSKRIGHFFFWYVRSEVAGCPYFRQRMAVILEAYLLGCGQAMIDSFTQQVQAVESLEKVALNIKKLYPDKTDLPSTGEKNSSRTQKNTTPLFSTVRKKKKLTLKMLWHVYR